MGYTFAAKISGSWQSMLLKVSPICTTTGSGMLSTFSTVKRLEKSLLNSVAMSLLLVTSCPLSDNTELSGARGLCLLTYPKNSLRLSLQEKAIQCSSAKWTPYHLFNNPSLYSQLTICFWDGVSFRFLTKPLTLFFSLSTNSTIEPARVSTILSPNLFAWNESLLNFLKLSAEGSPHVHSGVHYWARELKKIPTEVFILPLPPRLNPLQ